MRISPVRIAVVVLIGGMVLSYLCSIIRGRIPTQHRLGAGEIAIAVLTSLFCIFLIRPDALDRLTQFEAGGVKISLKEVVAKQERQEDELKQIQLIIPLLLPEPEQEHLRNLASGRCQAYVGSKVLQAELRHLSSIRMIERTPGHFVSDLREGEEYDLSEYVKLTDRGSEWLARLDEWKKQRTGSSDSL